MRCNWCGSYGNCNNDCECQKCIDPKAYDNWKFNSDGTFSESYKIWVKKEREKYNLVDDGREKQVGLTNFFWD